VAAIGVPRCGEAITRPAIAIPRRGGVITARACAPLACGQAIAAHGIAFPRLGDAIAAAVIASAQRGQAFSTAVIAYARQGGANDDAGEPSRCLPALVSSCFERPERGPHLARFRGGWSCSAPIPPAPSPRVRRTRGEDIRIVWLCAHALKRAPPKSFCLFSQARTRRASRHRARGCGARRACDALGTAGAGFGLAGGEVGGHVRQAGSGSPSSSRSGGNSGSSSSSSSSMEMKEISLPLQ